MPLRDIAFGKKKSVSSAYEFEVLGGAMPVSALSRFTRYLRSWCAAASANLSLLYTLLQIR